MKKLAFLLFLLPGFLLADVVYLKGGGKFTGRIVEQTAEQIFIETGDGTVGFGMDRVEKIERGPAPLDEFDTRAAKLGPQDVNGWRDLALWASAKGLAAQARAAYQRVLAIAPDDPEAREALGFVKVNGQWLTEEEGYRARGYVKFDGEWMTPAEAQLAQASAAKEQAHDEADQRASDAKFAADMGRLQKQEDDKRAREEADRMRRDPVYWGGFGYGVGYWPPAGTGISPAAPPPAGGPR